MTSDGNGRGMHRAAEQGFAQAADDYVRGRPGYPPEVRDWLTGTLGLGTGTTVLDLGAGTGKFTTLLAATGARVIAVEPVAQMREKLVRAAPDVLALNGTAEAIPLEDASVDAVVSATAFHWFATRAALAEMHRVLRPGGVLGLVWNVRDTRVEWVARLDTIVESRVEGSPRFHTGEWRRAFPFDGFTPLEERRVAHAHTGPVDDVIVNRVRSSSVMSGMAPQEWAAVERTLRRLVEEELGLGGNAVVAMPYVTAMYHARKSGDASRAPHDGEPVRRLRE